MAYPLEQPAHIEAIIADVTRQCAVFISSTSEDLKEYRLAARDAVLAVGLRPEMMEYFAASGGPPLPECLANVAPCQVVVVVVAHRYGWVPPDQPDARAKSITWLECEYAAFQNKDLLVFLLNKDVKWPVELKESYRSAAASENGTDTPELIAEVRRDIANLKAFRQWLETGRTRLTFGSPDDLRAKVVQALYKWLDKHPEYPPTQLGPLNPRPYLGWLRGQTARIDIRGLGAGAGKARKFPTGAL